MDSTLLHNCTSTFTGRQVTLLAPQAGDICLRDIAHALGMQCRFNGHCTRFYSVAQHSVLLSEVVAPEHALLALMHDAAEAYIGDITTPVKRCLPGVELLEGAIFSTILRVFPSIRTSASAMREVHEKDRRLCLTEAQHLMPLADTSTWNMGEPLEMEARHFASWEPQLAYGRFMYRADELGLHAKSP